MDTPYDRIRDRNAARNVAARNAAKGRRKKRRSQPNPTPQQAPRSARDAGNNQGGGGGGQGGGGGGSPGRGNPFAPKWGRYNPGEYDPDTPYNQPERGPQGRRTGFGKYMGEMDPEALLSAKFGRAGISYEPNSPDEYDQFIYDQAQNALMGLRTAQISSPNLTARQYFSKLPIFQGMGDFGEDETGTPEPSPRRPGRHPRPRQ